VQQQAMIGQLQQEIERSGESADQQQTLKAAVYWTY